MPFSFSIETYRSYTAYESVEDKCDGKVIVQFTLDSALNHLEKCL